MTIHPDDIGDFLYKQKMEDRLSERPEEEVDLLLSEIHQREEELDQLWEEHLKREAKKEVRAAMRIIDSILSWIREEREAA